MVHLGGGVADTRRSGCRRCFLLKTLGREIFVSRGFNGASNVTLSTIDLDGLYHQQKEGNEHKLGSCLVEFFSALRRAGRRLRFRRLCMKTGLELI